MELPHKRNKTADVVTEPSPVIHLRFLPRHTLEKDLFNLFQLHGNIREISMLPHKNQAFVEFENIGDAENAMEIFVTNPVKIGSSTIPVSFSTSRRIIQRGAMVEMDTIDSARDVKRNLSGADIYDRFCNLKIDYARPTQLTVHKNNAYTWDYESNSEQVNNKKSASDSFTSSPKTENQSLLGSLPSNAYCNPSLLPPSICGQIHQGYTQFNGHQSLPYRSLYPMATDHFRAQTDHDYHQSRSHGRSLSLLEHNAHAYPVGATGNAITVHSHTSVAMVYNMDMSQMNCDRLFNILCIYGNVNRIKFLHSHEGCAMVQMGDPDSVDRAVANISGSKFMDTQFIVRLSKQNMLMNVPQPFDLPDGTPSFKDYSHSQNNRYRSPLMASKNRKYRPSRALHYWNCPPHMEFTEMVSVFTEAAVPVPMYVPKSCALRMPDNSVEKTSRS